MKHSIEAKDVKVTKIEKAKNTKEEKVVKEVKETKSAETEQKHSGRSKALTIIGIIMCVILVPILVVNVTMIIKSYIKPDEYPSFAGFNMMIVLSPSMEPTINTGDLIIVKNTDAADVFGESAEGKGDGMVISFFDPDSQNNAVLTHRCVKVVTKEDGSIEFITKGDNNDSEDLHPAPAKNLIGSYVFRIPGAGHIAMWLQTTPGLIVCVAVPIVLLVAYDLIIKKKYDKKKKNDTDALLAELELLRAQAEKNASGSEADGNSASPDTETVKKDESESSAPAAAQAKASDAEADSEETES